MGDDPQTQISSDFVSQKPHGVIMSFHSLIKFPLVSNTCTRTLLRSATYKCLLESIAMACGKLKSPWPVPNLPHAFTNLPFESKWTMRLLPYPSETNTSPSGVIAISVG